MVMEPVKSYKGWDIYYEDDSEATVPSPAWILVQGPISIWLPGYLSLSDVEEFVDTQLAGPYIGG